LNCGQYFKQASTENNKFCSRSCSSLWVNKNGLSNGLNAEIILKRSCEFIKTCRHTPTLEEIAEVAGVSTGYYHQNNYSIFTLFEKAGRKNKSVFPSKFEEMVYYSILDCGIKNEDIERQKTYKGLYTTSKRWLLRFDFYVKNLNLLVEADGPQHEDDFSNTDFFNKLPHVTDMLKNNYATNNNISLVRIPYSPYFNIVFKNVSDKVRPFIQ
jgi:hypothetical protein